MLLFFIQLSRVSPLIAGILTAVLGVYVFWKRPNAADNRYFFLFCLLLFVWAMGCWVQSNTSDYTLALAVDKVIYSAASLFPLGLLLMLSPFLNRNLERYYSVSVAMGGGVLIANWVGGFRNGVTWNFGARFVTVPGVFWYVYLIFFALVSLGVLVALWQQRKCGDVAEQKRIRMLFVAVSLLVSAGAAYFQLIFVKTSAMVDSALNLYSSVMLSVFSIMVAYTVAKYEFLNVNLIVTRKVATVLAAIGYGLGFSGIYFFTKYSLDLSGTVWLPVLTVGYIVSLAPFFQIFQRKIQTTLYKKFLSTKPYDFEKTLRLVSEKLMTAGTIEDVLDSLLIIQENLEIGDSYALFKTDDATQFECSRFNKFWSLETSGKLLPIVQMERISRSHPLFVYANQSPVRMILLEKGPKDVQNSLQALKIHTQSLLIIIKIKDEIQAIFIIGQRLNEEPYTTEDMALFEVVLNQAVTVFDRILSHNQLHEALTVLKDQTKKLKIVDSGKFVQEKMLIEELPKIEGLNISCSYEPALAVSGDYFKVLKITENTIGIILADVTGKGVPAALYMGLLYRIICEIEASEDRAVLLNPQQFVEVLNKKLIAEKAFDKGLPLVYAVIDRKECVLRYVNAGLDMPVLLREGKAIPFKQTDAILNADENDRFTPHTIKIQTGDVVVFFTDCFLEKNKAGEGFVKQVEDETGTVFDYGSFVVANAAFDGGSRAQHFADTLKRFLGDPVAMPDDVTVVVVEMV